MREKPSEYSIVIHVEVYKSGKESYPDIVANYFKQIYFEALDTFLNSIKNRFNQPGYQFFSNIEQLLLRAINKESYTSEMETLSETHNGDFNLFLIFSKLALLPTIRKDFVPINFEDILNTLQLVSQDKRSLISNVVAVIRVVLTNGATSASLECLFSMTRRLKTWLCSTVSQKMFNS